MIVKTFTFNAFMENTYLLYDETKEAIVIDAGMNSSGENQVFKDFIDENGLTLKHHLLTHAHVDHVLGSEFLVEEYKIYPKMHRDGIQILETMEYFVHVYELNPTRMILPKDYLSENETFQFGNSELRIMHTPGHAAGSLCFVNAESKFVVTGDVLFKESIGRTDLPTGNLDVLMHSIKEKLFVLDNDYIVYPGHGGFTSIGYEKSHNPFLI
jgi:glyoxylase-like metal-dependent hydrolase (beta-lactamase superfamily II)